MSMKMLTVLQLIEIFAAYGIMTLLLPAILLYGKIKHLRFSVRFMIYQMVGNFYMINLVFVLQLLHISCAATLWMFTLLPFAIAYIILHKKKPWKAFLGIVETLKRLATGQLGARLFIRRLLISLGERLRWRLRSLWLRLRDNLIETLLVAGVTVLLLWLYGSNALNNYGYCASDIPVHNYWINYLGKGEPFVAGVYPFGFHCVIYYLHTVFGIETYVLLRLFWLVQTLMIHYLLLAFIRVCCKSKYTAYLGIFIYSAVGIFAYNTFIRYYSSLPQEFGMLFILPSIYFLFAFMERKHKELENPKEKKMAHWYLVVFAMSFSMTLAAHFYDTVIAGIFCIGIAVGYVFRLFKKPYFGRIMLTGILSIVIAVLPMGIAYATGTPLQGSLGWGMNVITGENAEEEEESETETERQTESVIGNGITQEEVLTETEIPGETPAQTVTGTVDSQVQRDEPSQSLPQKFIGLVKHVATSIWDSLVTYLIPGDLRFFQLAAVLSILLLAILAVVFFRLKQTDYAARFMSTAACMVFMSILLGASQIGIPALMDGIRTGIFYAYLIVVVWSLCFDGILELFMGWMKKKRLTDTVALVLLGVISVTFIKADLIKEPQNLSALQTNEALTCLTNIIYENEDFTWTICSANDELRMAEDYGYHYEVSTFLGQMEYSGGSSKLTIPTHTVYFFIEKRPIDYSVSYENSGQFVSKEGAKRALPRARGVAMYQGENRWIEMSRMYYWAQEFMKLYPNEMEVYYETEDFVCYRVEQNDYRLYNFSIDYGYNMMENQMEQE